MGIEITAKKVKKIRVKQASMLNTHTKISIWTQHLYRNILSVFSYLHLIYGTTYFYLLILRLCTSAEGLWDTWF